MNYERKVELTSLAFINQPKELFSIIGGLNSDRSPEHQVGVELYPSHPPMGFPGPGRITLDDIQKWTREFGPAPVTRVHLPFHYNLSGEARYFLNTVLKRPGTDWGGKVRELATAYFTSNVRSGSATKMAAELGAGLNAHGYTVQEAARRGEVGKVINGAAYVWVENDSLDDQGEATTDPQKAIDLTREHELDGIIIGVDHNFHNGEDPVDAFFTSCADLKDNLRAVHLSGSNGRHGLITEDDKRFWDFIGFLKSWDSNNNLRYCLDLNPMAMGKLNPTQKKNYVQWLITTLES